MQNCGDWTKGALGVTGLCGVINAACDTLAGVSSDITPGNALLDGACTGLCAVAVCLVGVTKGGLTACSCSAILSSILANPYPAAAAPIAGPALRAAVFATCAIVLPVGAISGGLGCLDACLPAPVIACFIAFPAFPKAFINPTGIIIVLLNLV